MRDRILRWPPVPRIGVHSQTAAAARFLPAMTINNNNQTGN
jgi:hypothetical protein